MVEKLFRINNFMEIKWIVYKVTNKINNRFYIGVNKVRSDNMLNEAYLGSGPLINKAIKKYGRSNFIKEIIEIFDAEEQAYTYEEKIVNPDNPLSYNLKGGGFGGRGFKMSNKQKRMVSKVHKGKKLTEENKQRVSQSLMKFHAENPNVAIQIGQKIHERYQNDPSLGLRMQKKMKDVYQDKELRKKIGSAVSAVANWAERPGYIDKMSISRKASKRYKCTKCQSSKCFDGGNFSKHCKLYHAMSESDITSAKITSIIPPLA